MFLAATALFAQEGGIQGTVRDTVTKVPVAGAEIVVTGPMDTLRNATTDVKGEFHIENLPPGAYQIKYTLQGYLGSDGKGAARVTVNHQQEFMRLDMTGVASIEGTVLDEEGHPMAGVILHTQGSYRGTTDSQGHFEIDKLEARSFLFTFRPPLALRKETLKRNPETGEMFGYPEVAYYPGVSDTQSAAPVVLAAGVNLHRFDVRLRRVRLVNFSGRVIERAGGEPLTGARVELTPSAMVIPVAAGEDGSFQFDLIPPGSYSLLVYRGKGERALPYTVPVEIGKSGVQDLKVPVPPFAAIPVTIVGPPDAEWTGQVIFRLRSAQFPPGGLRDMIASGRTYVIEDLPPGRWVIHVDSNVLKKPEARRLFVGSVSFGAQDASDLPILVSESGNPPLEVRLTADSGRILGTVVDGKGDPVKKAMVVVMRAGLMAATSSSMFMSRDDGTLLIEDLAPGSYRVMIVNTGEFVSAADTPKVEVKAGETATVRLTTRQP